MSTRFMLLLSCFSLMLTQFSHSQTESIRIASFEKLMQLLDERNLSLKNAGEQEILARQQTLAAKLNMLNIKPMANFSLTDNLKLNVLFLPGEAFGGAPGSFKQITTGQQYISNFNLTPQLDLFNPQAIGKVGAAKAYESVTNSSNQLARKNLYENLATTYYNCLLLQEQVAITKIHLANMDSLTQIVSGKLQEGISRQQELNNILAAKIGVANKLNQLEIGLEQQLLTLRLWCDLGEQYSLVLEEKLHTDLNPVELTQNTLLTKQKEALISYYSHDLKASRMGYLPTLSLVGSWAWQQNTNGRFLDNQKWIHSSYIGLRMSVPLVDFTRMAVAQNLKISLKIAENERLHAVLQDSTTNRQLALEYQKSLGDYHSNQEIEGLRAENYNKAVLLFREGILSPKDMLESSNDLLSSKLNTAVSSATQALQYTKIRINNQVK